MEGDKLIFLPEHDAKAHLIDVTFKILEKRNKYVLTIGGQSGTGKTEVAALTRHKLFKRGFRSVIVSLDDYYITNPDDRRNHRQLTGIIGIDEINWELLDMTMCSFLNDDSFIIRRLNKYTNSAEQIRCQNKANVMIIEGLYALHIDKSNLRVHLCGDPSDTEEFRKQRKKEVLDDFRRQVLAKEQQAVESLKDKAHLTLGFDMKSMIDRFGK